jgi:ABC-2 type transport system ATP-binding protein
MSTASTVDDELGPPPGRQALAALLDAWADGAAERGDALARTIGTRSAIVNHLRRHHALNEPLPLRRLGTVNLVAAATYLEADVPAAELLTLLSEQIEAACGWLECEPPLVVAFATRAFGQFGLAVRDLPGCALIQIPVRDKSRDELRSIVAHEVAHAVLACGHRVLDEGWAQWFERSRADRPAWHARTVANVKRLLADGPRQTLEALLGLDFRRAIAFEDQGLTEAQRELLPLVGSLLVDSIVNKTGASGLKACFDLVQRDGAASVTGGMLDRYLDRAALAAAGLPTEFLGLAASRPSVAEILAARVAGDVPRLVQLFEAASAPPPDSEAKAEGGETTALALDAVTSIVELQAQPDAQHGAALRALNERFSPRAGVVADLVLKGRAQLCCVRLVSSPLERASFAGRAERLFADALAADRHHLEAKIGVAQLLIHTPAQFGGNRARGHELLREVVDAAQPESTIAARALQWLGAPAALDIGAPRPEADRHPVAAVADQTPLLRLRGVRVPVSDQWAVQVDELTAQAGEIVGIVGANGAGKSVFIEFILGLRTGQAAEFTALDEPVNTAQRSLRLREQIGAVVGSTFLNPGFKVREIVRLLKAVQGPMDPLALATLSSAELEQNTFSLLSAGQKQRVRLLAAFHPNARLLVLDEPSTGLDHHFLTGLMSLLKVWRDRGAALLLATHEERLIELCDQMLLIGAGRVLAAGRTAALCESLLLPFRIVVSGPGLEPMRIAAQLENARIVPTGASSATIYCREPLRRQLVGMAERSQNTEFSVRAARPADLLEVACGLPAPMRSRPA